jgi:hypothetical protein
MKSIELLKTNRKIAVLENLLNAELSKAVVSYHKVVIYEQKLLSLLSNLKSECLIEAKRRFKVIN